MGGSVALIGWPWTLWLPSWMWPKAWSLGRTLFWTVLSSSTQPTRCSSLGTQSLKPAGAERKHHPPDDSFTPHHDSPPCFWPTHPHHGLFSASAAKSSFPAIKQAPAETLRRREERKSLNKGRRREKNWRENWISRRRKTNSWSSLFYGTTERAEPWLAHGRGGGSPSGGPWVIRMSMPSGMRFHLSRRDWPRGRLKPQPLNQGDLRQKPAWWDHSAVGGDTRRRASLIASAFDPTATVECCHGNE